MEPKRAPTRHIAHLTRTADAMLPCLKPPQTTFSVYLSCENNTRGRCCGYKHVSIEETGSVKDARERWDRMRREEGAERHRGSQDKASNSPGWAAHNQHPITQNTARIPAVHSPPLLKTQSGPHMPPAEHTHAHTYVHAHLRVTA